MSSFVPLYEPCRVKWTQIEISCFYETQCLVVNLVIDVLMLCLFLLPATRACYKLWLLQVHPNTLQHTLLAKYILTLKELIHIETLYQMSTIVMLT